jgi:hypothetical protein
VAAFLVDRDAQRTGRRSARFGAQVGNLGDRFDVALEQDESTRAVAQ